MTAPATILLVEDSPSDAALMQQAVSQARLAVHLERVADGASALAALRACLAEGGPPLPDLVLLDLGLPDRSGLSVLREIRATQGIGHLPVIVLTSSSDPDDVRGAYRLHAQSFITKPQDPAELLRVVRTLESWWLSIVRLP